MPIPIGPLSLDADFLIAYAIGLVILLLFCIERFNEPAREGGNFVGPLLPRHLANGTAYLKAFLIYLGLIWLIYTGLSILGPYVFIALDVTSSPASFPTLSPDTASGIEGALQAPTIQVPAWVPLAVVLFLSGATTHFRFLNQVELLARRATHRSIGIPNGIERLAKHIATLRMDRTAFTDHERAYLIELYNQCAAEPVADIEALYTRIEKNDVLRRWLRLNFLVHIMETRDLPSGFDRGVLGFYSNVWNEIVSNILRLKNTQGRLALIGADEVGLSEEDRERRKVTVATIDRHLDSTHALIAVCVAQTRHDKKLLSETLQSLYLPTGSIQHIYSINYLIVALAGLFATVLLTVFLTRFDPITAIQWASGALVLHGSAALAAWKYWSRAYERGRWQPMQLSQRKIPAKQYVKVVALGFLAGMAGLAVWHILDQILRNHSLPVFDFSTVWIPAFALLGGITAFWVSYTFDLTHRETRRPTSLRRLIQALMQAATTGAVAYFITLTFTSMPTGQVTDSGLAIAQEICIVTVLATLALGLICAFLIPNEEQELQAAQAAQPGKPADAMPAE